MNPTIVRNFNYLEISLGHVPGHSIVNKHGSNDAVGITHTLISHGGYFGAPSTAQSLEIVSSDANDTALGTGAREVTIYGLDANWNPQEASVSTNGGTAAVAGTWMRVHHFDVSASGTYDMIATGANKGLIELQVAGGGTKWGSIEFSGIGHGASQIGGYTVPKGFTAYISNLCAHTETTKSISVFGFKRESSNIVTAPYAAMQLFGEYIGIDGSICIGSELFIEGFPEYTDIGFFGLIGAGTGAASIDYNIVLVDNNYIIGS